MSATYDSVCALDDQDNGSISFPGDLPEQLDHVMVTAVGPAGR